MTHIPKEFIGILLILIFPLEILLIYDGPHKSISSLVAATGITLVSQFMGWRLISSAKNRPSSLLLAQLLFFGVILLFSIRLLYKNNTDLMVAGSLLTIMSLLISTRAYRRAQLPEKPYLFVCLLIVGFYGIISRLNSLWIQPLGSMSDMLTLVQQSLSVFFESGVSPYKNPLLITDVAGLEPYLLDLTYLPIKWLAYSPTHSLGIDPRYTNIFTDILILCLVFKGMKGLDTANNDTLWFIATLFTAYFLNPYVIYRLDSEIYIFSFLMVLFVHSLIFWQIWASYTILGLLLATNQLTLLLIPFLLAYDLNRRTILTVLKGFSLTIIIFSIAVVPFMLVSLDGMIKGIWSHWDRLELFPISWAKVAISNINFSVLLFKIELQQYLKFIQIFICSSIFATYLYNHSYKSLYFTLLYMYFCILLFLLFNIVVWTYLFEPLLALTSLIFIAKFASNKGTSKNIKNNSIMDVLFRKPGIFVSITVSIGLAIFITPKVFQQLVREDFRIQHHYNFVSLKLIQQRALPKSISCHKGQTKEAKIEIANKGQFSISSNTTPPTFLSYHVYIGKKQHITQELRTTINLNPGTKDSPSKKLLSAKISCDLPEGAYQLKFQIVQEGVAWLDSYINPNLLPAMELIVSENKK